MTDVEELAVPWADVRSVVVLTGAGISADSGLATFRGAGGLWEGHRVEEVATPDAWARDPARVWRFYQGRRAQLAGVEPNPAHLALAEFEGALRSAGREFTLVSQNVDDLHQRAGSTVLPMHGELAVLRCESCGARVRDLEFVDPEAFLPCRACGAEKLRPNIVWFGEVPDHLGAIQRAVRACDLFLAIGTRGEVYPAAGYLELARGLGATTVVQALEKPSNADVRDHFLGGRAAEVVPALVRSWIPCLGDGEISIELG